MRKFLLKFTLVLAFLSTSQINAQRYLDEVFDSYQVIQNVSFGVNVNPLISNFPTNEAEQLIWQQEMDFLTPLIFESITTPDTLFSFPWYFFPNGAVPGMPDADTTLVKIVPLIMDVYMPPASDVVASRPTFVNLHTGNFLPALFNGATTGDKVDSIGVNFCKQMAKRGYVAVNINYRLGWNPISGDENVRRGTLLQAVYRAVLDAQTAVRFLKSPAGAAFGIDSENIILMGQGSGGYVTQAYTTLNDYVTEIAGLDKFIDTETGLPYVIPAIDGSIEGGPGFVRLVDPLQFLGFSKDVAMSANMGGALADSTWLEAGDVPMVSFQCIRDPFAPFDHGTVVVPTTNENVVPVDGANVFIRKANEFGNNDAFASIPDGDPYTDAARSTYGQTYDYIFATQPTMTVSSTPEGLYPFVLPLNGDVSVYGNQGSPWDWWDFATLQAVVAGTNAQLGTDFDAAVINGNGLFSNPDMSQEKGLAYLDTVMGYLNPRVVLALNLVTGIAENPEVQNAMSIYPNPSINGTVVIRNDKAQMKEVIIMDALGRTVFTDDINGFEYRLDHNGWNQGMYFVTVLFDEGGQLTKKLIIK